MIWIYTPSLLWISENLMIIPIIQFKWQEFAQIICKGEFILHLCRHFWVTCVCFEAADNLSGICKKSMKDDFVLLTLQLYEQHEQMIRQIGYMYKRKLCTIYQLWIFIYWLIQKLYVCGVVSWNNYYQQCRKIVDDHSWNYIM